jgi:hypothetical protein
MTADALHAIEPKLKKLTPSQRQLLDISVSDMILAPRPQLFHMKFRFENGKRFMDYYFLDVAYFASNKIIYDNLKRKMVVKSGYPFDLPKQICLNVVLSREIQPDLGDFIISQLNIIVLP